MAFQRKKVYVKCNDCLIHTKNKIEQREESCLVEKKGNGDILFILEMPEKNNFFYKQFKLWLRNNLVTDYQIITGLRCQTKDFEVPSPMYKSYRCCDTLKKDFDCKVIIPIGRAIMAVTQSDDLGSWRDFAEYKFNQTYFYTPFDWKNKTRVYPIPALHSWVDKNNFECFFALYQLRKAEEYLKNPVDNLDLDYTINDVEDVNLFLDKNMDKVDLAWDLETKHLDHFADDFFIICMTASFNGVDGYYLDYDKINKRKLVQFFSNKKGILANGKFDKKALYLDGIKNVHIEDDVTLLHHVLNTQRISNSIKALAWLIGFGGYDKELELYKEKNKVKYYSEIPRKLMLNYSCLDSIVTYKLNTYGYELAEKQPTVLDNYKKYIIPSIPFSMRMEVEGMPVDVEYINKLNLDIDKEIKEYEDKILTYFGETFEIGSNQQLAKILEKNNWSCQGTGKQTYEILNEDKEIEERRFYSVGDEQLVAWINEGYDVATDIREYKSWIKLKTAFVGEVEDKEKEASFKRDRKKIKEEGIVKYIKSDGRIHPTYNPGRANTIRYTVYNPNPQQFPKRGKKGKLFRPVIACPDDWYILEVDYSGFQLRIACILSKDPVMRDIFLNKGGDMHSISGQSIFCRDILIEEFLKLKGEEPYKSFRDKSKSVNFGFIFGMIAFSFMKYLYEEWTEKEVLQYIQINNLELLEINNLPHPYYTVANYIRELFFDTYKGLQPWIDRQHDFAEKNGYVDSWHGMRRHMPMITHKGSDFDNKELNNFYNIAVNSPVQTFEAVEALKGGIKIYDKILELNLKSYPFTTVHDSFAFYVPKDEIKVLYKIVKDCMEDYDTWDIPILVDVAIGKVWGFGEEIKDESQLDKFMNKN